MSVWYIRPVAGTDSNSSAGNGDSFATARKRLTNLTAASLASGDSVRIEKSPDATSLAINGTWTTGPNPPNISIASSTNATPIVVTATGHGLADDDTVLVYNHGTNTNANGVWKINVLTSDTFQLLNEDSTNSVGNGVGGASGTITKINSSVVRLASQVTKNITGQGNRGAVATWTQSSNVTTSVQQTNFREGGEAVKIALASNFSTGKAAYVALGSIVDFSAYQQLSLSFMQTAGTVMTASDISIKLCSDTIGAVAVDTFNIPSNGALNTWCTFTIDKGSNLSAVIQSVGFYVNVDRAAQTFIIDNLVACKAVSSADSLSLSSLIGKSSGNYFPIQSINSTRVIIDAGATTKPTVTAYSRGYYGTSETVTTYKRECWASYAIATGTTTVAQLINDGGTSGSPITITGGWNTTDMTTQTGSSWFDGVNGYGYGLSAVSMNYLSGFDNLAFVRYYRGISMTTCTNIISNFLSATGCQSYGAYFTGSSDCDIGITYADNNDTGLACPETSTVTATSVNSNAISGLDGDENCEITITTVANNFTNGVILNGDNENTLNITNCKGNGVNNFNITSCANTIVNNCSMSGYGIDVLLTTMFRFAAVFNNCVFGGTTTISGPSNDANHYGGAYCQKYGQTANDHRQFLTNGNVVTSTGVVHSTSAYSWKLSPTTTTRCTDRWPFKLVIAQIQVSAVSTTVTCWFRRTNTGISARLVCKGGQIGGVATDVTDSMTVAADTWEQLSINFTPNEAGVVEIIAECFGGTTYSVYVDDFAVA
jgi:hypothetical protein